MLYQNISRQHYKIAIFLGPNQGLSTLSVKRRVYGVTCAIITPWHTERLNFTTLPFNYNALYRARAEVGHFSPYHVWWLRVCNSSE